LELCVCAALHPKSAAKGRVIPASLACGAGIGRIGRRDLVVVDAMVRMVLLDKKGIQPKSKAMRRVMRQVMSEYKRCRRDMYKYDAEQSLL
jgi:hypothetical protein